MSALEGKVKNVFLKWDRPPEGEKGGAVVVFENGKQIHVQWKKEGGSLFVVFPNRVFSFDVWKKEARFFLKKRFSKEYWECLDYILSGEVFSEGKRKNLSGKQTLRSQMPGKIVKICVQEGTVVQVGDPVLIMEAMKMENEMQATMAGKVTKIYVCENESVETQAKLLEIQKEEHV